jgi:folate-binding protein YgfZ
MLFDLAKKGIIKASGEDAESFLQNQLSNDVHKITETEHQASAWCSPKGRIIVSFQIFKRNDDFFLILSADLLEHVIKKLRMYVMMSKVVIEDVTASLPHFGLAGDQAEAVLIKAFDNAPSEANQILQIDEYSILKLAGNTPRFEIIGHNAKANVETLLGTTTLSSDDNHWNYLYILAGIPHISEASSEAWIPQMVNYIAVGGVDFKKGCYPGQEVVARLNYLGKTKRRMYRLQINTDNLPNIGDAIASDSDTAAGKILNVALNPDGVVEALAIMKIAEVEKNLTLTADEKITISLLSLPYSLDDE